MSKRAAEYVRPVGEPTDPPTRDGHRAAPAAADHRRYNTVVGRTALDNGPAVTATGAAPPQAVLSAVATPRPRRWLLRYQVALLLVDSCAAFAAIFVVTVAGNEALPRVAAHAAPWLTLLVIPIGWVVLLAVGRAYEAKALGSGPTEFERVLRAFFHLTAATAFVVCAGRTPLSRDLVLLVLPLILVFSVSGRCAARVALRLLRQSGRATFSVVAIGDAADVAEFVAQLRRDKTARFHVVGMCTPERTEIDRRAADDLTVPHYEGLDRVVDAVQQCGADAVAVLSASIKPDRLRWISWQLENSETMLFVSPGLTEVAGRRLHIQQVCGLPLLNVAQPAFSGVRRLVKGGFDRSMALIGVLALAPVLALIAVLVRCTSRGPVLFFQTRVGKDGRTFRMIKFRTMVDGAESRVLELVERNDVNGGVLFKVRNDPRVTRVGRTLRRYSLDELPQLLNVLQGSMSLVGPRPPLPAEVARYGASDKRRLLVKPGLTGLWQISGRSDLSWEESVRLDLRYVENWSLTTDLMILLKTVFAVARQSGAY
jgi:exopolysaccharide biosynthesis polyprenyl glycosylphosphotransferase